MKEELIGFGYWLYTEVKKKEETKTDPSILHLLVGKWEKVKLILVDNVFAFRYGQLEMITGHPNREHMGRKIQERSGNQDVTH